MAVINTGSIVNDIRGSVGTETYARNQGGIYVRARTTPSDPNTADQQACRAAVTALSQYWSGTLTEQQRADWRAYAHQHPRNNRWGQPTLTNGYTRFVRLNFTRYRINTAVGFDEPPVNPPLHPPVFTFIAIAWRDRITIDLTLPTYQGGFPNLQLFAYVAPEVNPGRNFFNGPWRYNDTNIFNGGWDADPWHLESPFVQNAGMKVFVRLVAQMADPGEMSEPYQTSSVVIP